MLNSWWPLLFLLGKQITDFYFLYSIKFSTAYLNSKKNRYEICKCKIKFVFANILFDKRVEEFADLCYNIRNIIELSWEGLSMMRISYNKLWKMLIDKEMKKSDLKEKAGISSASLAKLGKGDNITTDVLLRICEVMDCRIEDILETIKE